MPAVRTGVRSACGKSLLYGRCCKKTVTHNRRRSRTVSGFGSLWGGCVLRHLLEFLFTGSNSRRRFHEFLYDNPNLRQHAFFTCCVHHVVC